MCRTYAPLDIPPDCLQPRSFLPACTLAYYTLQTYGLTKWLKNSNKLSKNEIYNWQTKELIRTVSCKCVLESFYVFQRERSTFGTNWQSSLIHFWVITAHHQLRQYWPLEKEHVPTVTQQAIYYSFLMKSEYNVIQSVCVMVRWFACSCGQIMMKFSE